MTNEIVLHRVEGQSIYMPGILMTLKATAEETDGAPLLLPSNGATSRSS